MATEAIPALTELVVVADSTSHHKQLNSSILRYMRSDKAAIRLAAVQCEQSLTDRLGEEWLAHLPAMLPFISELQEDDDELVEQATHQWIRKIESILGESLKPMLQ
jgi:U3 small nucleolar RNA-associated protein 10